MNAFLNFEGHKVHYSSQGNGPALVLLHGFLESKEIWDNFAASLARDFTVVCIDLPGHGKSDIAAGVATMELMATITKAVLDHLGISSCVIAGHSMGGYASLAFTAKYPETTRGLVLFHAQAAPDSAQARENRQRTITIVKKNRSAFIRQFFPDLFDQRHVAQFTHQIGILVRIASGVKDEGIIAALEGMKERKGWLGLLTQLEMPVLFIAGKQDSRIPFNLVLEQAAIPAHSEVLLLDNVGHMGFIEASSKTLSALRHFGLRCFETTHHGDTQITENQGD
jgi:pimeloyl-ACP methyl ester carboxylesterase